MGDNPLSADHIYEHSKLLLSHWKQKQVDLWGGADAVALLYGKKDDTVGQGTFSRTGSMMLALFEHEIRDSMVLFTRDQVVIVTSAKKAALFGATVARFAAGLAESREAVTEAEAALDDLKSQLNIKGAAIDRVKLHIKRQQAELSSLQMDAELQRFHVIVKSKKDGYAATFNEIFSLISSSDAGAPRLGLVQQEANQSKGSFADAWNAEVERSKSPDHSRWCTPTSFPRVAISLFPQKVRTLACIQNCIAPWVTNHFARQVASFDSVSRTFANRSLMGEGCPRRACTPSLLRHLPGKATSLQDI